MKDEWRVIEQLAVNSLGETNYVIGHDEILQIATIEERAERQSVVVSSDAMDAMARWWLERRGWQVVAPSSGERREGR